MKKSCKSANHKHPKNYEDSRNKNKDPIGLRRLLKGRNSVPKVPWQVIWRRRPKNDRKSKIGLGRKTSCA